MATNEIIIRQLGKLKSTLLKSGIQQQNQPLYQVINQLLDAVIGVASATVAEIDDSTTPIEEDITAMQAAQVLTAGDETAAFPNSRELLAGSGILFDDTTPNERTISATATGGGGGGMEGEQGPEGDFFAIPGPQGPTGNPGAQGIQGPIGLPGLDGEDGEQGYPGPPGIQGPTGSQGIQGTQGLQGIPGDDGTDGEVGPQGLQGIPGATGATGPAGPIGFGLDGEPGEDGWIGPAGPQGPAGTSGGGSFTFTDFTQDLGAAEYSGTFDITGLSSLTADKNVLIVQTMQPISSKGDARDEFEMQPIILTGYVLNTTTIRALWSCQSICVGDYAFAYAVSA